MKTLPLPGSTHQGTPGGNETWTKTIERQGTLRGKLAILFKVNHKLGNIHVAGARHGLGGDSRGLVQEKVQGQKLHYGGERLSRKLRALKIWVSFLEVEKFQKSRLKYIGLKNKMKEGGDKHSGF